MKSRLFLRSERPLSVCITGFLLVAAIWTLTGCGGRDSLSGYYALQVNPAPEAPQDKMQMSGMVFGFERLAFNEDHTFRLGPLHGNWSRSGDKVTLEPTTLPQEGQFYSATTMAEALAILLKPADFTVSEDEKTLKAVNPANGPVVFTKTGDGLK